MLIKFSPFSATHRQQVYFPSTKQRKNAALTSYRAFSCFFFWGGGTLIQYWALIIVSGHQDERLSEVGRFFG